MFVYSAFECYDTNHDIIQNQSYLRCPGADRIKLFILHFLFYSAKLSHFTINEFFSTYITNAKAYHRKTGKKFVSKEKKFYRIGFVIRSLFAPKTEIEALIR